MSKYYKYISYFTAIAIVSYVLAFVIPTIISRLFVPLSVEHQEGVHATMIWMWNKGVNLYSYPSKEFSSWIYTPGFYVIGKLWTDIFGLSIPVLRGLSLLSMFITALFSGFMIFKITQSKWISSLWLFIYLTLFHLYGWIDNANKESLHIMICFISVSTLFMDQSSRTKGVLGGILWSIAFITKQTTLFIMFPLMLYLFIKDRKLFKYTTITFIACATMVTLMCISLWGWNYITWTIIIPSKHAFSLAYIKNTFFDFLYHGGFAYLFITGLCFFQLIRKSFNNNYNIIFCFVLGCMLSALILTGKSGGGIWCYSTAVAGLSLIIAISFQKFKKSVSSLSLILLILCINLTSLDRRSVPNEEANNHIRFIEHVKSTSGNVWIPHHPWVNILANKKPYVAIQSVLGEWTNAGYKIPGDILNAINNKEFNLIITDDENFDLIKNNYILNESLPKNKIPIVKDGWMSRNPKYVWLPK